MTDLENAIKNLDGHSIALCKDDVLITDDGRGISPMMKFISQGRELSGFSCADAVVGKAAAELFVKAGIIEVYGKIMSRPADKFLTEKNIPHSFSQLADNILNVKKSGLCPMESAVKDIDDPDEAYSALKAKVAEMKKAH